MLSSPQKGGHLKDWKGNVLIMSGSGVAANQQFSQATEALPNKYIMSPPCGWLGRPASPAAPYVGRYVQ